MPCAQAALKFFGIQAKPQTILKATKSWRGTKEEIISPPLEISVKAKDQVKLQVTDGVLQKVNPWLVLLFIIY